MKEDEDLEPKMQIIIITGMSGAGKSNAANILEDLGYYCVDNMPVALMPKFAEFCISSRGKYERVAMVTDIRSGDSFEPLFEAIDTIRKMGCECRIIFLCAEISTIIMRYKETRRRHPIAMDGETIEHAVQRESEKLQPVKERADYIIDTTDIPSHKLRDKLLACAGDGANRPSMAITVMSFGFKYGIPAEADLVFDVRFLPNPYYIAELRELTGLDDPVRDFVFNLRETADFLKKLYPLLGFLLPNYEEEGKGSLTICIGCTGGQHRSTAIAKEIAGFIQEQGYHVALVHRDVMKRLQY